METTTALNPNIDPYTARSRVTAALELIHQLECLLPEFESLRAHTAGVSFERKHGFLYVKCAASKVEDAIEDLRAVVDAARREGL